MKFNFASFGQGLTESLAAGIEKRRERQQTLADNLALYTHKKGVDLAHDLKKVNAVIGGEDYAMLRQSYIDAGIPERQADLMLRSMAQDPDSFGRVATATLRQYESDKASVAKSNRVVMVRKYKDTDGKIKWQYQPVQYEDMGKYPADEGWQPTGYNAPADFRNAAMLGLTQAGGVSGPSTVVTPAPEKMGQQSPQGQSPSTTQPAQQGAPNAQPSSTTLAPGIDPTKFPPQFIETFRQLAPEVQQTYAQALQYVQNSPNLVNYLVSAPDVKNMELRLRAMENARRRNAGN